MPKSILVIGITALLLTATNSFSTPNTISARRLSSTPTHKSPLSTLPAGHGHSSFLLAKKADASPDEEKQKKAVLDTVLNSIERNYGRGSIMRLGDNDSMDVDSISTGALTLDVALGGGLPRGRVVEIYGPESSGKTTLALHVAAASQKTGGVAAFIDAEHALDPAYAERLGVNVDELLVSQPDSGEMALDIVDQLVRSSAVDVVIIDSVAALVPRAELEGDMSDAQIGLQARLMSKAMRKITGSLSKSNCCVIFLNQLRSKVGVIYGSPEVTSGGNALKFYSSVRLDTRRKEVLPDNAGINVKVKVVKNKIAAPFKVIFFDILFGTGIDSLGCMLDAAADFDIVVRKGSWYSYKDTNFAQGKVRACAALEENPEMREEIEAQVREALLNLKNGDPVPATVVAVDDPPKVGSLESEAEAETVVSE
ncbi:hypothetical protein TrST_g7978 [Triparma strigata]|uniref:Bacterial recombinase A n=1 Tax=Triparma strigata TaxID=1606541 RepID=A0A9W7ALV8_9STRA|nr:hypothetical protein TrST_g7978 [Triparma strigata]